MESYEAQLVHDIMAAGDLTAIENLIQSLFGALGSKIPSIRNPRRLGWYRAWRESLARVGELSRPPRVAASPEGTSIDLLEVDLCAKRVVADGDAGAIETLLHVLAEELNLTAVSEGDPERRIWMAQAGGILRFALIQDGEVADDEAQDPGQFPVEQPFTQAHPIIRMVAFALLLMICLSLAGGYYASRW